MHNNNNNNNNNNNKRYVSYGIINYVMEYLFFRKKLIIQLFGSVFITIITILSNEEQLFLLKRDVMVFP